MPRRFQQVDVFGARAFAGNPLAVVLVADGLSTEQMQTFTRWMNLSESAFVLPSTSEAADYRVRIFTLTHELPFAGHPTIGTAVLLGEMKNSEKHTDADALLLLEEGLGLVRCAVAMVPGTSPRRSHTLARRAM